MRHGRKPVTGDTVGERIRLARVRANVSQKELAKAAGITSAYISAIETGCRECPSAECLARLARALGTSVDHLLGKTAQPPEPNPGGTLPARKPITGTTIGERVKLARVRANLTQRELGKAAGVTGAYVSAIETGIRKRPSPCCLLGLAAALGTSVKYLIGEDGTVQSGQPELAVERIREFILGTVPDAFVDACDPFTTAELIRTAAQQAIEDAVARELRKRGM